MIHLHYWNCYIFISTDPSIVLCILRFTNYQKNPGWTIMNNSMSTPTCNYFYIVVLPPSRLRREGHETCVYLYCVITVLYLYMNVQQKCSIRMTAHYPPLAGAGCSMKEITVKGWTKSRIELLQHKCANLPPEDSKATGA